MLADCVMETTANDHLIPEDEDPGDVDLGSEYRQEVCKTANGSGRRFRSMKHRQRKRAKSKPTRPSTYIGQRGNRAKRKSR